MNKSIEQQKHIKKTEYLYAQVNNMGAGNIIASCLLVVIYWNQLNNAVLLGWLAAVLAVIAHRFYAAAAYRRRDRYASGDSKWYKIYANSVLVNGCLWGVIAVYIANQASPEQLPYVLMILGALVACASISKSSLFEIYTRFATPALLAPGIYLLAQFSSEKSMIGALVLCWFALMFSTARRFNRYVARSLCFEFENVALLNELETRQSRVQKLEKALCLQEKIITNLERSISQEPQAGEAAPGTRLATDKEKSAIRLIRRQGSPV